MLGSRFETLVLVGTDGEFTYIEGFEGSAASGGTMVFPEPHSQVVTWEWIHGGDTEECFKHPETLGPCTYPVSKIDTRIQHLIFEYDDIRSYDNVEFEFEGTIYWQV